MNVHVTKVFTDLRTKARADTRGHSVSIMITCTVGPDTYLKKKWNRHYETIAKVIKLHTHSNFGDILAWEFLQQLIDKLGSNGMSSDETCHDGVETVYWVKVLEWCRPIDSYLKIINDMHVVDSDLYWQAGSRPGKRLQDGKVKSKCLPVSKLPHTLYKEEWLDKQITLIVNTLCISQKQFEWVCLMAKTTQTMGGL